LDARLTTLHWKKKILLRNPKKIGNRMQYDRIFYGRLWLLKGCFARDDDDDDENE
jgi:hypothetical protein